MRNIAVLKRVSFQFQKPWIFGFFVFVWSLLVFIPFSRLGVDPHHDGIMLSSAIFVAKGMSVQSEVYAQYGPISTWIQALEINIFGTSLLTIRIGSAIALALSAGLFAISTLRLIGIRRTSLGIIVWISCTPFFDSDLQMLPWSSDYFVLLSAFCLAIATSPYWEKRSDVLYIREILIGVLLGWGIFLRLNPALPILLLVLVGSWIYISFSTFRRLFLGSVLGISSVLFVLLLNNGVIAWWDQSIIFPRKLYAGILKDSGLSGLRGNVIANGVPALLSLVFLFAILTFSVSQLRAEGFKGAIRQLSSLLVVVSLYWMFSFEGTIVLVNPRLFLWGVVLGGILFLPIFMKMVEGKKSGQMFGYFMLVAIGLGSLVQVFPVADRRHLWWATLPGVFLLLSIIPKRTRPSSHLLGSAILILCLVIPAFSHARSTLSEPRLPFKSSDVLDGMLVTKDFHAAFDSSFSMINDLEREHGKRAMINLCSDGLFATSGSRYLYPDPYYVYWSFPRAVWSEEKRQEFVARVKPLMWLCSPITKVEEVAAAYEYRIISRPKCLDNIERFNSWPLASWLAVPKEWPVLDSEMAMLNRTICSNL